MFTPDREHKETIEVQCPHCDEKFDIDVIVQIKKRENENDEIEIELK